MKKRFLALTVAVALMATACGSSKPAESAPAAPAAPEATTEAPAADAPAEAAPEAVTFDSTTDVYALVDAVTPDYKIGIMSSGVGQGEEAYREAQNIQKKYGEDKIIVDTFPENAVSEQETTISKVMAMASDPDVKAILFNQAQDGTIAAIKAVKEVRDDIITVACTPNEDYIEVASVADVVFCKDMIPVGEQFAQLAVDMGAKNFFHYSFPRHMSSQTTAARCEKMREVCEANGVNFVEVSSPDPQSDAGIAGTQQFMLEDIPRQVKEYGPDSVFFGTNTAMGEPIIKSVYECGAMFVGQADPTPYSQFPTALGIDVPEDKIGDRDFILNAIEEKTKEAGLEGRIATYAASLPMLYIDASYLIARCYLDGLVSTTRGDEAHDCVNAILTTCAGEGAKSSFWVDGQGAEHDNVFGLIGAHYIF